MEKCRKLFHWMLLIQLVSLKNSNFWFQSLKVAMFDDSTAFKWVSGYGKDMKGGAQ